MSPFPALPDMFGSSRRITNEYNELYRSTKIRENGGSEIAIWRFFGPSRVAELQLGNGLVCTYLDNSRSHSAVQESLPNPSWGDQSSTRLGYDGAGRPITKRY